MDNFFRHARAHTLAFQQPTETYLATVHLVVRVEPGQAPEDAVSAALTERLGAEVNGREDAALVDWAYTRDTAGRYSWPAPIEIPSDREGAFIAAIPSVPNRSV